MKTFTQNNISFLLSFRKALSVSHIFLTKNGDSFPVCPRCKSNLEFEYQSYCDRCGQHLDWKEFHKATIIDASTVNTLFCK